MTTAPRQTARVVPVAPDGQVMLLRGEPQEGRAHWFTIGGALEAGETPAQAAVRELFEETGIRVLADALGEPFYVGPHVFVYGGRRYEMLAHFFALPLDPSVELTFDGLEPGEIVEEHAWGHAREFALDGASEPPLLGFLEAAVDHVTRH